MSAPEIRVVPINDGREEDCQCARCGSSVMTEDCWDCDGDGYSHHDCGEDTCCCLHPENNVTCGTCGGRGGWWRCISTSDWCEAHPMPGRETVERGTVEWYDLSPASPKSAVGAAPVSEEKQP